MMKKGKYELAEFIQAINSLADELPDEMCLMIKDSLGSMTLQTAKMMLDAIGVPSTVLNDQESYEALISAAFSAIVEKSYCRELITKDLEKSLKNISEMTFREFDCKFLYIRCPMLLKLMDIENGSDDGVIAFAYLSLSRAFNQLIPMMPKCPKKNLQELSKNLRHICKLLPTVIK